MSEKPESDEYEEDDDEELVEGSDDLDIDHLMQDLDKRKRGAPKPGEPAWRRLERYREERQTAELLSDIDDFDIADQSSEEDDEASRH
jgi:hypothetical protein